MPEMEGTLYQRLVFDFFCLNLSQKREIAGRLGLGSLQPNETDFDYSKESPSGGSGCWHAQNWPTWSGNATPISSPDFRIRSGKIGLHVVESAGLLRAHMRLKNPSVENERPAYKTRRISPG